VYGEKEVLNGIKWNQYIISWWPDAPAQIYRSGNNYLSNSAALIRTPWSSWRLFRSFANIQEFCSWPNYKLEAKEPTEEMLGFSKCCRWSAGNGLRKRNCFWEVRPKNGLILKFKKTKNDNNKRTCSFFWPNL
jgi:hypothetical protein